MKILPLLLALSLSVPAVAQEGPVATGGTERLKETAEALRNREALAYAQSLPPGAPTDDYSLVAWCEALVAGHVEVGESLNSTDELDLELIRLGRVERDSFAHALRVAESRQTPARRQAAAAARARASALWDRFRTAEPAVRDNAFGLFFGLPGRCEHAARRIRENVTTPPATLPTAPGA